MLKSTRSSGDKIAMNLKLARSAPRRALDEPLPHLAEHPEIAALLEKIATYQKRLADTVARRERAIRSSAPPKPQGSAIDRADRLAAGGFIPGFEPKAEVQAADNEEQILRAAISEMCGQKDEAESRINYETSLQFQEQHVAALRRLDASIGDAWVALRDLHEIDGRLRAAGYMPSCSVLPANVPRALYTLSDPNGTHGEAPRFRQWLAKTFGDKR